MRILWAVKAGAPDWDEQLITEHEDQIPAAMEWAKSQGFDRFRIAEIDLDTPPDFIGALNV